MVAFISVDDMTVTWTMLSAQVAPATEDVQLGLKNAVRIPYIRFITA